MADDRFTEGVAEDYRQLNPLKRYLFGHEGFICGGCFKQLFTGERVKDYDMFFENATEWKKAVDYMDRSEKWSRVYQTDKVIAFRYAEDGAVVELINYVFGTPEQILSNFDFTITKMAFGRDGDGEDVSFWVLMHERFFEHLFLKRLVIDDKLVKPASTFERVLRYSKYGYFPCRESKLKLLRALSELPAVSASDLTKSMYDGLD